MQTLILDLCTYVNWKLIFPTVLMDGIRSWFTMYEERRVIIRTEKS